MWSRCQSPHSPGFGPEFESIPSTYSKTSLSFHSVVRVTVSKSITSVCWTDGIKWHVVSGHLRIVPLIFDTAAGYNVPRI